MIDCAGNPLEGVVINVSPAAAAVRYLDATGKPTTSLTSTFGPYAAAIALNAPISPLTITASKAGLAFDPVVLQPFPNRWITVATIHPTP